MNGALLKDRYLLQDLLGEGGMGRVYRAVDTRTREAVAVKVLTDAARRDPKLLRSLWREVRAVARMLHPNIVQVLDYGQARDDSPFLVMEYVPGRGLDAWRGRIGVRDLVETFDGILAALAYAHARGVVHRDLKPENVLIVEGRDGTLQPKLVDFGVARVAGLQADASSSLPQAAIANLIVGTPAYMSPEQAQGSARDVGPESDLYALGVVLYEFVSGELPFNAPNTMSMLFQHVSARPMPLLPPVGVILPPGLEDLVMKLLEKRPEDRFAFASDVRRALRRLDWAQATDGLVGATSDDGPVVREVQRATREAERVQWLETVSASSVESVLSGAQRQDDDASDVLQTIFSADPHEDGAAVRTQVAPGLFGLREVAVVGRDAERRVLWSGLERALGERSVTAVILSGPAGVGTSRLARWLTEKAEEEGLARCLGHGVGEGTVLPAGGLRGLLERHLRTQGLDPKRCAAVLNQVLVQAGDFADHELGPLLTFLRPPEREEPGSAPAIDPVAVVGRVLRAATRRRPITLWLDDVDGPESEPTLDLIEFLLATRNLAPLPVFVVVTTSAPHGAAPKVAARLREIADGDAVTWVDVQPLSVREMAHLVGELLPLTEHLAETTARRSNGNPATAVQILSHWLQQGQLLEVDNGRFGLAEESMSIRRLPTELGELMRTRLGAVLSLCPDVGRAQEILKRAAVCGRRFELALLEELLRREGRNDLLGDLDVVWDRLVENDLWLEVDVGVAQFGRAEVHDLVRTHLVNRAETMRLRGIVADALLSVFPHRRGELHAEVAAHLAAAGQYDRAVDHELLAGQQALRWAQFSLAHEAFTRAQSLLQAHPLREAIRVADEVDLGMASWALRAGAYDVAAERLESIEQRMLATARRAALARAALLRAELTHKRGELDMASIRYREARDHFAALSDSRGVARALQGLADVQVFRGHGDAARDAAVQARALNEDLDDPWSAARCLLIEGKVARMQLHLEEARRLFDGAAAGFERAGDPHGAAEALTGLGDLLRHQGRFEEACTLFEDLLWRFIALGDPNNVAITRRALGSLHFRLGRLQDAAREYQGALALSRGMGDRLGEARALNGLGEVARRQERWDEAVDYYDAYIDAAESLGAEMSRAIGWANLGLTHAERGHWEAARDGFRQAVDIARRAGNREYLSGFLAPLGLACAQLAMWEDARAAIDEALQIDRAVHSTQPDFLRSLEDFAVIARHALAELARAALVTCYERWTRLGDAVAAQRIEARLTGAR